MPDAAWVDRELYPFRPNYLNLDMGRMHYVDEGTGDPLVMVHGTPTWSFLFRHLIRELSTHCRTVAPDHIGFGLSDKPDGWSYRPADHARNLTTLVEHLRLRDITLAVHDFGGPIGLSYALEHPENISRLILFNTWMWSRANDRATVQGSRILGGPIGRFLYRRLNFSPRVLMRVGVGKKNVLTRRVHRQYVRAFPNARQRTGHWILARELIASSDWYESLWQRRDTLRDKPALILWGMKDPAFGAADLARWRELFPKAHVVTFPDTGHFVPEEQGETLVPTVARFMAG